MSSDDRWYELVERCDSLEPGTELVTPVSERRFAVESAHDDRVAVRFRDSGEERTLWREQFDIFVDRLEDGPVPVAGLPPGVEPYAALLTLSEAYDFDGEEIDRDDEATGGESPLLVPPEEARTAPERVRDDALLLASTLEELGEGDPDELETGALTDLYVLLSDVQRGADGLRKSAREPLLERLGPDQQLRGRFGTVRRTTRERRRPKDEETVLDALDERGIPREWVLGIDTEKLDVVLAATDLSPEEVYDVEEQVYVQKTGVDEGEKYGRLQGIAERIDELEGAEEEAFRDELADLEDRLEDALSAG